MEHELFQCELKPLVGTTSLSKMIRSTSSGENPHRAAVMELLLDRSIQERRGRTLTKVRIRPRSDPTPQPKKSKDPLKISIPQVEPPTSLPAPQPPSQSSPNTNTKLRPIRLVSSSAKCEPSLDWPILPRSAKDANVLRYEEDPPPDANTNAPLPEDIVGLRCRTCSFGQLRSQLRSGVYCEFCFRATAIMKCVGCGTIMINDTDTCTNCRRRFK